MTLPRLMLDTTGNVDMADAQRVTYDSITNVPIPAALQPFIVAGTGTPNAVLTAPKGSMFIRLDGGAGTRLYMNTDGAVAWVVAGSAA